MDQERLWQMLTRIAAKAQQYQRETYFRDGLADAAEVLGERFAPMMERGALLMVKPDGLAGGKAATIVEFLKRHDYAITAVETPLLGRFTWRELWRFQLTSATLDRLAVNDLVLRHPALLLMLRYEGECDIPATVRLSVLKGPSDVASQSANCLRRLIGQPNRVFSFFHVADEPADLLRELAILLEGPERRRALASLGSDGLAPGDLQLLDETLAASTSSSRELDAAGALRRALDAAGRATTASDSLDHVRADLERMREGAKIAWRPFMRALQDSGLTLDGWDVATLGASFIVYDEPGHTKQIVAVDPTTWRQP